jgi:hypothetical protein
MFEFGFDPVSITYSGLEIHLQIGGKGVERGVDSKWIF